MKNSRKLYHICCPQTLCELLWQDVFPKLKLWEFFQVNVERAVDHFNKLLQASECLISLRLQCKCSACSSDSRSCTVDSKPSGTVMERKQKLKIIQDPQYKRFGNTVDMKVALDMFGRHTWVSVPQGSVLKEQRDWPDSKGVKDYVLIYRNECLRLNLHAAIIGKVKWSWRIYCLSNSSALSGISFWLRMHISDGSSHHVNTDTNK